jgi:hypothetical protein
LSVGRGAVAALGAVAVALGCSGRHDLLAATDSTSGGDATTSSTSSTSSSASGGAGHGGAGGHGGGATATGGGGAGAGGAGTGGADAGPPGPTTLTIVNGVNDYASVRLCFLGHPGGEGGGAAPWPQGGLPFAKAHEASIASVIPASVDVRPTVLAGDLAQTLGMTCDEILAAPPDGVRAAALPIVPKSAFTSGKSLVMVALGCLGGPDHVDASMKLGCGDAYTPVTPTASLAVVAVSRASDPSHVGLQVVHASLALPMVDVRINPGTDGAAPWQVASSVSLGSVDPVPPFADLDVVAFGALDKAFLSTHAPGDSTPTSATPFGPLLAAAGLEGKDFVDGAGFALVAVGGYPGVQPPPWWHALTYAVIRTAP